MNKIETQIAAIPAGWGTPEMVVEATPICHRDLSVGKGLLVAIYLEDDSYLFALIWPGGSRWMRSSPTTRYAIEERYEGLPPNPLDLEAINAAWAMAVKSLVATNREFKDEELPDA